jgi:hypothetical protein
MLEKDRVVKAAEPGQIGFHIREKFGRIQEPPVGAEGFFLISLEPVLTLLRSFMEGMKKLSRGSRQR